ncbi:MAG: hypothetical protein WBF38_06065 [Nitrosotalea sp.]
MERLIAVTLAVLFCCSIAAIVLWPTASAQAPPNMPQESSSGATNQIPSLSYLERHNFWQQNPAYTNGLGITTNEWFTLPDGRNIPIGEMYDPIGPTAYYNYFTFINGSQIVNDSRIISSLIQDNYIYPKINSLPSVGFTHDKWHSSSFGILWVKLWFVPQSPPTRKIFAYATLTSNADPKGLPVILEETSPGSRFLESISDIQFSSKQNTNYLDYHAVLHVNPQDTVTILFKFGGVTVSQTMPVNTNDTSLKAGMASGFGSGDPSLNPSTYGSNELTPNCGSLSPSGYNSYDGMCLAWETGGPLSITFNGATYTGPACGGVGQDPCPSGSTRDIYVVADAMAPASTYQLTPTTISNLQTSFKGNGSSTLPILLHARASTVYPKVQLHIQTETSSQSTLSPNCINGVNFPGASSVVPASGTIPTSDCDFNEIKSYDFMVPGESISDFYLKAQVFHYALLTNMIQDSSASGVGEEFGNDLMVTLGAAGFTPSSTVDQDGTFMHELGHNLGLYHGGITNNPNCMPNYLSVMNYLYQLPILNPTSYFLDYSQANIGSLTNAANTREQTSASKPAGIAMIYATPNTSPGFGTVTAGSSFASDSSGILDNYDTAASNYAIPECTGQSPLPQSYYGFKDWNASNPYTMMYSFYNGPNYGINSGDVKGMFYDRLTQIGIQFTTLNINNSTNPNSFSDLKDAIKQSNLFNFTGAISDLDKLQNKTTSQLSTTNYNKVQPVVTSVLDSYKLVTGYTNIAFGSTNGAINSNVTITVTDPDSMGNSVNVAVASDTSKMGTQLFLSRVNSTSDLFQGNLTLSDHTVPGKQLRVSVGDSVYASYNGVFSATMQVTTDTNPPPQFQVAISPSDFGFTTWPYPPINSTSAQYPSYFNMGSSGNQTGPLVLLTSPLGSGGATGNPITISGPVGNPIIVSGSGFAPHSVVTITYDGILLNSTTTTTSGSIPSGVTVIVPASTPGLHTVKVTDASSHTGLVGFTVKP